MKPIKNTKKVIKIANSMGVVIDKNISQQLGVKNGDLVEISFKKLGGQSNGKTKSKKKSKFRL